MTTVVSKPEPPKLSSCVAPPYRAYTQRALAYLDLDLVLVLDLDFVLDLDLNLDLVLGLGANIVDEVQDEVQV